VKDWVSCQIGARDHYLVPRALHRSGRLAALVTELWAGRWASIATPLLPQRIAERAHADLVDADILSFPWKSLTFEASAKARGLRGWARVGRRNSWFARRAAGCLRALAGRRDEGGLGGVFSYSYAAGPIFRAARDLRLRTLLGQIDAGPVEEGIVVRAHERHPEYAGPWQPAPAEYWSQWHEEIALSDQVIANSEWSRQCLARAGVDTAKIRVVPLAYEPAAPPVPTRRAYPSGFSRSRPLKVLFLGQVTLRKGIAELLDAAQLLRDAPVELVIAGPIGIRVPQRFRAHPRVRWMGPVPRSRTQDLYRDADVFILPTLSDGFAITQLEARARGLPLIVSRNCGEVVRPGETGLLLDETSATSIAAAIRTFLDRPALLEEMAQSPRESSWTVRSHAAMLMDVIDERRLARE
jgi:glycosyltransferase involved in cell wall biosynthesis